MVALQALAKYESTQYQGDVDFVATIKGSGIDHSFAVTENNKLVTQRAPLHTLPTSLSLTMVGSGCAVFQVCVYLPCYIYLVAMYRILSNIVLSCL